MSNKLKVHRQNANLSLQALGDKCGISKSHLHGLEKDVSRPTIDVAYTLCNELGVSVYDIWPVELKYYIHDKTRGCVGNSMVWWKQGHHGYTCDIREAHIFTKTEALERIYKADDLVAYPVDYIDRRVSHHIDMQLVLSQHSLHTSDAIEGSEK